jgi:hypothetical protein
MREAWSVCWLLRVRGEVVKARVVMLATACTDVFCGWRCRRWRRVCWRRERMHEVQTVELDMLVMGLGVVLYRGVVGCVCTRECVSCL